MINRQNPLRSAALALSLALVAAACGGDEDTSASGADAQSSTTAAGTPTTTTADDHDDDHGKAPTGAKEVDEPALRLLVADGASNDVRVVDLATGATIKTLTLPGKSRVYEAGRHVLAAVPAVDRLEVIDSGTWGVPHGDHFHHYTADPALTSLGLAADNATHVVDHHGTVAVFNDGDGSVIVIDRAALGTKDAVIGRITTGAAHHGVAVALKDKGVVIVTTPVAGEPLPNGVAVVDLATGKEKERFTNCPGLHGEVSTDEVVAFGCADGVLVLEPHDGHWHAHKIARPAGVTGAARTGTLAAGHDFPFLVGNLGAPALVRIDLEAETATAIPLPAPSVSFAVDPVRKVVLAVTVDGNVHRIDPRTGTILQTVAAIAPFTPPSGHGGPPSPSLLVAGDRAYLTEPAAGQVIELGIANELRVARRLAVGGAPASITVAGLPAARAH
jgi:hypothetical protein